MKRFTSFAATLFLAASLTSCSKTDLLESSGLTSGKGSISFSSSASFAGSTSFGNGAISVSNVTRTAETQYDEIEISVGDNSGSQLRTADLILFLPKGASTANGPITASFTRSAGDTTLASEFSISTASSAGSNGQSYTSTSGSVTITRLSSTEVEGTFNAEVADEDAAGNKMTISSGKFKGSL